MNKDFNSDYLRGHIDTIILKTLFDGEKYGYEICKDIETKSKGSFILKQPSLYSALKRLESSGLISSRWQDSEIGGKRHYYSLTEEGVEHYKNTQAEWDYSYNILHNLLSDSKENQNTESMKKNDAEFLNETESESSTPTILFEEPSNQNNINIQDNIEENNNFNQLNFFPDEKVKLVENNINNNEENNEQIISTEKSSDIPTPNEQIPVQKNDAEFINETIIDEDNDISFSNNVYFRVKNEVQKVNNIANLENRFIENQNQDKPQEKSNLAPSSFDIGNPYNYEIKSYTKHNKKAKKTEFIKKSKFYFITAIITSLIMALQITAIALIYKFCNIQTKLTTNFIIGFSSVAVLISFLALINLIINPYKKGTIRIKNQFFLKVAITLILIAVVIGINLLIDVHIFTNLQAYTTILIPCVLLSNIIVEEIIYNLLKNNVKFKA